MIVAKTVVDNQYWILKKDNAKIGNIRATQDGSYTIKILDQVANVKTIPMLRESLNIRFESEQTVSPAAATQVHGYPTECKVFNGMWHVQLKLPLFTKEEKSKSWYAAGWYRVKQHRTWQAMQNPKLIALERYRYKGPFYTKEQANDNSLL